METIFTAGWEGGIQCLLCPHVCKLKEADWGICKARQNINNKVIAQNYAKVAALAMDPIEKKPLYHFFPGKQILSIGTFGCNFKCSFCQNWQLAHEGSKGESISPMQMAEIALQVAQKESIGVAYTYSEPLMWYEYVFDIAKAVKEKGLQNVLVSNGYINPKPLKELSPLIDAANIDVKGFNKAYYQEVVGGDMNVVLKSVERLKKADVHIEITFLLVTSLNDSYQEVRAMVKWIKEEIGKDTPLHIARYFPNYKLNLPPTPLETLEQAYHIAKQELEYVYLGNVNAKYGKDTVCPCCGETLIQRSGYITSITTLNDGICEKCGTQIAGQY